MARASTPRAAVPSSLPTRRSGRPMRSISRWRKETGGAAAPTREAPSTCTSCVGRRNSRPAGDPPPHRAPQRADVRQRRGQAVRDRHRGEGAGGPAPRSGHDRKAATRRFRGWHPRDSARMMRGDVQQASGGAWGGWVYDPCVEAHQDGAFRQAQRALRWRKQGLWRRGDGRSHRPVILHCTLTSVAHSRAVFGQRIQQATGGTWGGCVCDPDTILTALGSLTNESTKYVPFCGAPPHNLGYNRSMRVLAALLLCVIGCFPMSPVESHLDRQLKSWQRRLGMDDWRLTIRLVRQNDLDKNTWGNAEWDPHGKTGTISVLDVADYNLRGAKLKLDMECPIVHELEHIQVGPFDAPNENMREDVVNRIMTALLNRPSPN